MRDIKRTKQWLKRHGYRLLLGLDELLKGA